MKQLGRRARYVGSPEHKTTPSFAGAPRPRADASKCDPALSDRFRDIQRWLQTAFDLGVCGGRFEGDFPRYVWCKVGGTVYEARLVNQVLGEYKGWPLQSHEWPDGINDFAWPE